jgi:hypothetical protein
MLEDSLDDRDFTIARLIFDAFHDPVMEIEFGTENIKMYDQIIRKLSTIRNFRNISFSNLLID